MTGRAYQQAGLAWVLMGVTGLAAAVAAGVPPLSAWRNRGPRAWVVAQAVVFAVLIAVFFDFANAADDNRRSAKPVCRTARGLIERPGSDVTLMTNGLPEEASAYLPLNIAYDPDRPNVLVIVDDRSGTAHRNTEWFQARLPDRRVVAVGRLAPSPGSPDQRWKLYLVTVDRKWLVKVGGERPAVPAGACANPYPIEFRGAIQQSIRHARPALQSDWPRVGAVPAPEVRPADVSS
jgi:hypothetical protein